MRFLSLNFVHMFCHPVFSVMKWTCYLCVCVMNPSLYLGPSGLWLWNIFPLLSEERWLTLPWEWHVSSDAVWECVTVVWKDLLRLCLCLIQPKFCVNCSSCLFSIGPPCVWSFFCLSFTGQILFCFLFCFLFVEVWYCISRKLIHCVYRRDVCAEHWSQLYLEDHIWPDCSCIWDLNMDQESY